MFRLLGLHPGPDISIAAAASLASVPPNQARAQLTELTRAHLITEPAPGRYGIHDLLRAYAGELTHDCDDQAAQDAAVDRVLAHYLHTAHHSAMLMEPFHYPIALGPPPPGTGDQVGEAQCLQRLGIGYAKSGRIALSKPMLTDALRLFEVIGDLPSQATTYRALAWVAERQQFTEEMLSHTERCYELYREAGHQAGQALALNDLGYGHAQLGHYELAVSFCEQALVAMRDAGLLAWEGAVWDSLGYTHHKRGDYRQAIACYEHAADLSQHLGDRFNEADTFNNIGDVHRSAGDLNAARRAWAQALRIFDEIDHPDRDRVRAKLQVRAQQPV
jgi:tetratricopeptide (TPR) repeat protein